jgi:hypothetical protein
VSQPHIYAPDQGAADGGFVVGRSDDDLHILVPGAGAQRYQVTRSDHGLQVNVARRGSQKDNTDPSWPDTYGYTIHVWEYDPDAEDGYYGLRVKDGWALQHDVLVIGGGGGGGGSGAPTIGLSGGGGAGGFIMEFDRWSWGSVATGVGAGGVGFAGNGPGASGAMSIFGIHTAWGGGGGGNGEGNNGWIAPGGGGSGGGGCGAVWDDATVEAYRRGGAGIEGQGHNGGWGWYQAWYGKHGGGGGGAGSAGQSVAGTADTGARGGDGRPCNWLHTETGQLDTYWAGGGGGAVVSGFEQGDGSSGAGADNNGGGGAGGYMAGASGQHGLVIVRYAGPQLADGGTVYTGRGKFD